MPLALPIALVSALAYVGLIARGIGGPARALKVVPALALATGMPNAPLQAAMMLCAAGDALLLDKRRFLLPGMAAFLLAQIAFVVGFGRVSAAPANTVWSVALLLGATAALARVWPKTTGTLRVAVPIYAAGLLAMASSASSLGPLGYAGGLVFLVSDGLLAATLVDRPLPGGHVAVMVTYYAALMLLGAAVLT